jgi:glutaminyl-tRNA synthetase
MNKPLDAAPRNDRALPERTARMRPDARADNDPASANFLRAIVAEDGANGTYGGRVVTRFPPEPNGYLHFGHAKSIVLNFGLAADNGGTCHLRFDDTNPLKEEVEYEDSIAASVRWLGYDWGTHRYHASDYYDALYAFAEWFVAQRLAYVDSQSAEALRATRGTLTQPGVAGPYRDRSVDANLDLLRRMRAGEFADGAHVLRLRIDMASPNINMRDPVVYRIRHARHHRTGDKWCIFPLYDYTHCISDALERVTHSICTLEFQDHRPLYDWIIGRLADGGKLDRPLPHQYEFARLNLTYVVLSKRKLLKLVEDNYVDGWDDPRMPTLVGARRRGYTPAGFRSFNERIGVSKSDSWIEMSVLEDAMRDDLNATAPRRMAVLDPIRLVIDNYPEGAGEGCTAPNHPQHPEFGHARALDRARRFCRDAAQRVFPTFPGRRSAPSLRVHRPLHRRRTRRARQRQRRPLHVRRGHPQRQCRRRCAQGEGQHPLAVRRGRGGGRSAVVRSAVPGAVSRRARDRRRRRRNDRQCGAAADACDRHCR